jgi:hypothetical protein
MAEAHAHEGDAKMIFIGFMAQIARLAMFGRHVLDTLDKAPQGWTAVVYREPKDEAGESKVLVGAGLDIAMPEPFLRVEFGRGMPLKKGAAS